MPLFCLDIKLDHNQHEQNSPNLIMWPCKKKTQLKWLNAETFTCCYDQAPRSTHHTVTAWSYGDVVIQSMWLPWLFAWRPCFELVQCEILQAEPGDVLAWEHRIHLCSAAGAGIHLAVGWRGIHADAQLRTHIWWPLWGHWRCVAAHTRCKPRWNLLDCHRMWRTKITRSAKRPTWFSWC